MKKLYIKLIKFLILCLIAATKKMYVRLQLCLKTNVVVDELTRGFCCWLLFDGERFNLSWSYLPGWKWNESFKNFCLKKLMLILKILWKKNQQTVNKVIIFKTNRLDYQCKQCSFGIFSNTLKKLIEKIILHKILFSFCIDLVL
jgi:hypothetical protein